MGMGPPLARGREREGGGGGRERERERERELAVAATKIQTLSPSQNLQDEQINKYNREPI